MTVTVRQATAGDARAIAAIRVASWRAAYAGLLPDPLLNGLDVSREARLRALHWATRHTDPRAIDLLAVVEGMPVGWASAGPCRDEDTADRRRGELLALYTLPTHWSTGAGHALITAAEARLRDVGFTTASLWVLDGNERAAGFYQRHGWHEDGAVKDDDRLTARAGLPPLRERRRVKRLDAVPPDRPGAGEDDGSRRPDGAGTVGRA